ncbi:ABC transporter substrate-binding protein [Halomonas sp. McH1-25]|uniref:ABC transporter substrate-binding protein n=1 Tax=Halomonas sp. BBD45 TaxID=1904451 RepID=UPI00209F0BEB|nr:ABC transporter substrate-binding protein [Halomonas sp. BBD45]MCG7599189.1 ABC transporter substrate-binding protein [Halomonas sp. McH1-25]MCP1362631.1 ABC transporter substrate-binding protein [Halomonas sp. BBD45]
MKVMKTHLRKLVCAVAIAGTAGASMSSFAADCPIPGNLRVVIGSTSTGGDTYQNSSIVADHLAKKLDINAKVDAVGAMAGFRALDRSRNGNTVMIFHDQAYLGNLYGVKGYDNIFEKYTVGPTVAINPGNAYLVPKDSPYQNIDEVIAAAGEGEEIRVAIQPGGVSEIGFSALKNAVKVEHPGMEDNVVAVNTGSQADKNQLLFDDMADVINGSVQANEQYTRLPADDQKAMRFVWLTARNDTIKQTNEEGMGKTSREDLLQYVNPNVTVPQSESQNFTFDKEFFFLYNKDMNPEIVSCIDNALEEIYAQGDIQEQQKKSFFIPNFKPSSEAQAYLKDKRDQYKTIIENIK